MPLVFDNELYDMTGSAEKVLLSDDVPYMYSGEAIFDEFPYFGNRTDLVTVRYDVWDLARRLNTLGHLEPLPDERRYRNSYNSLQDIEPVSKKYWVEEDTTYRTDQTCREVWDWLLDHEYLRPCDPEETGRANVGQATLGGSVQPVPPSDEAPCVTVKYPLSITANAWELKQRDWRTALRQAKRADCYVDYRWVLMDAGGVDVDHEVKKPFREANVGLATLDGEDIETHIRPKPGHPPKTAPRFMLNERAVEKLPSEIRAEAEEKAAELEGDQ